MGKQSFLDATNQQKRTGMEKRGNAENQTDAAHKLSNRVLTAILENEKGRPLNLDSVTPGFNSGKNIIVKSTKGNRILDERRDKRIVEKIENRDTKIQEKTTLLRTAQAYDGAIHLANKYAEENNRRSVQLDNVVEKLGNLEYQNRKPGRDIKVKNLPKGNRPD